MRVIANIVKDIKEEIHDAEKYMEKARLTSDGYEKETYKYLANQELDHVDKLHDLVTRKIQEHKQTEGKIPEGMMMIWDFEHQEIVKDVDDIKSKIGKI